ncbi:MAG: ArsR/SmtB family transcription factor [Ferrimicrobium sp.]
MRKLHWPDKPVIFGTMEYREPSQSRLYEQLARIGKVIAHPKRIELLELLDQGERSVEALAVAAGLKLTTASAHLQVMRQAHLVETRRDATRIYYRIADEDGVRRFITALGSLARTRLVEVEQILRETHIDSHATERITRAELLARAQVGDVVVIDVRPLIEYHAGHIAGAISVPLEQLQERLDELDPNIEVVAYCRGPLCLLAPQAVVELRKHGRRSRCLEDGMPEWRHAGLPVAFGPARLREQSP